MKDNIGIILSISTKEATEAMKRFTEAFSALAYVMKCGEYEDIIKGRPYYQRFKSPV